MRPTRALDTKSHDGMTFAQKRRKVYNSDRIPDSAKIELSNMSLATPIVLDNGSSEIKIGFAGDEVENIKLVPNLVGTPLYKRCMGSNVESSGGLFVGKAAERHRGILSLSRPMSHGEVTNWAAEEKVWSDAFSQLSVRPEDHSILVSEPTLCSNLGRQRAAEVLFETFNVPAVFFATQAVLALYAEGAVTGCVLDSGDGVSHCVPVYEGFAMSSCVTRSDIAGRDVTERLASLLHGAGHRFATSAEMQIVDEIKRTICVVPQSATRRDGRSEDHKNEMYPYELPDGRRISIDSACRHAPELLFTPTVAGFEQLGASQLVNNAIERCGVDMRRKLYGSIYLAGGSTLFAGYADRLFLNLKECVSQCDTKITVHNPPARKYSVWIGGGVLSSLASFRTMWIDRKVRASGCSCFAPRGVVFHIFPWPSLRVVSSVILLDPPFLGRTRVLAPLRVPRSSLVVSATSQTWKEDPGILLQKSFL